jgi:hypothetical protein
VARGVWLVHVGTGALDRSVIVRCGPGVCDAPRRVDDASVLTLDAAAEIGAGHDPRSLAEALAWIDEAAVTPPPPPHSILEEWWLWAGIGAVAIGAGVGVGLAAAPSGDAPLVLRIDPCTSCGR